MKHYKVLSLFLFLFVFSKPCFASPANKETVLEVIHASKLDKIPQILQSEQYIHFSSEVMIASFKNSYPNITHPQQQQIQELFKKCLQSPDFEIFLKNRMSVPFFHIFQEEELIHLLQIYEAPLAQQFFEQTHKSILDLNNESYTKFSLKKQQDVEDKIQKLLNTL